MKYKTGIFELLRNSFAADVETTPVQIQMELIELQCNGTLKAKYDTAAPHSLFAPSTCGSNLVHVW